MNYKLISMDFDGTLLTSDKKVTKTNKDALLKYKSIGYIIVGITARNFSSVNNVCDINMFNYLILNNGAFIYDVQNKSVFNLNSVDQKTAVDITNYFNNIAQHIDYCSLNKYYIYKKEAEDKRNFFTKVNSVDEITEIIGRMNIFLKDEGKINIYKDYIEKNFKNLDVLIMSETDNSSNRKWLSLNPSGLNKSVALKELCKKLNISIDEVIFFGDGMNDVSIISKVGLGVAMGNALDEVKKHSKEITLSNDENRNSIFFKEITQ